MKQLITLTAFLFTIVSSFSQTKEQDSLVMQFAFQKLDSTKVDTSIELIKSFYDTQDFQKALGYISETEKLSASLNYHSASAQIKYYKALIYAQNNDYFNAIDNYNTALRLYNQLQDSLGIAKVNNSIGLIEIKRGNYNRGLRYSLSAIDIFESKNLRSELSSAYNNLAEAYFMTNQVDKALEFNTKALQVREQLRDSSGIKSSTKNIAILYSMRKEHRRAIEYFEKLLALLDPQDANDMIIRGEILPRIGDEYLQFNDYQKAATYLLDGLRLNRSTNNKAGILRSLNSLAQLNFKQRKVRLAEVQLNEAYGLTRQVEDDEQLLKNYKIRVAVDSAKGDFRSAFRWQSEYHNLDNKLKEEKATPLVIEEEPYDIEQPTNTTTDNSLLPVDDKKLKQFKLLTYILGGALLIALIAYILTLMNGKNRKEQLEELEETNKQYKLQNDSILEQTRHLEEMNQVKDRLFSIVSHDLKDSITGVKAFLDLLREDSISQEEFDELIPELSENADNAAALLMNLLNWSKSQMQNLEPKPELFNIQDVFQDKMNLVQKKVEQKNIIMLDESIKDFVYADRSMIEIVIQNLLANAVKFSRVGDVITISNRERNGNVLICIEDTGVGISEENQKKLFKNGGFTTRGTNAEKGTGLGLSICKQMVELNYGKIWVESEPNLGSKFFVELPKAKPIE
ncbi:tetratricopeptide repeat-containing sensor histidine kinase [Flavobacteriaceae sp. LMIT009]